MIDNSLDSSNLMPDRELIARLELACQDLLWYSEAEYPLQIIYWQNINDFDKDYLLKCFDRPAETKIAVQEFNSFFATVTKQESWHNEAEQSEVKRYQAIAELLTQNLTDIQVYLVGEVEIDVYILGKTSAEAIAGIGTKIVCT